MSESSDSFDVVILGTGPAGLQAAIHAARRKVRVLVLGREHRSSAYGAHIENLCCVGGATGRSMLEEGRRMAEAAGALFRGEDVVSIARDGENFALGLESGVAVRSAAVVLAMGIARRRLNVPGEEEFKGRGVSACVECDAGFFRGEPVAVVGEESAAVTGALTMLFYASEVHLVAGRLEVAPELLESLRQSGVVLHENRKVAAIEGTSGVERLVLDDGTAIAVTGVFVELGARGLVELAAPLGVALDAATLQYVTVGRRQETSVPGIWAAGDLTGPPWQVAKAVGEGCVAGLEAASWARRPRS